MRAKRRVSACIVVALLLALPVMAAAPAEGGSWWGWLAEGWASVVRLVAGSETEPPAEEPAVETDEPEDDVCLPTGCAEVDDDGGPSLDPNG